MGMQQAAPVGLGLHGSIPPCYALPICQAGKKSMLLAMTFTLLSRSAALSLSCRAAARSASDSPSYGCSP
eukprot:1002782-Pelagomonas_calceolata.AAC.1